MGGGFVGQIWNSSNNRRMGMMRQQYHIVCTTYPKGQHEHVTQTDPHSRERLMKGLDEFLERDRDRELFDLAPRNTVEAKEQ